MRYAFSAVIIAGGFIGVLAAPSAEPAALPGDEQDLVFFHDDRPYLIRLHIHIDGRPLSESWDKYLGELFRYLDRNNDGSLDAKELELAPSLMQLQQQIAGVVTVEPAPPPTFAELDVMPRDGKISPEELSGYYRRSAVGPLQVEFSWRAGESEPFSEALFARLDRNKDGKLSREELAAENFQRLDLDDDELITTEEIAPRYTGAAVVTHEPSLETPIPQNVRFVPSHRRDPAAPLVQRLLARYDRDRDEFLSTAEIGLDREEFRALDADGDGKLSAAELEKWPQRTPDLELLVLLGKIPPRDGVRVLKAGKTSSQATEDGLAVTLGGWRLELLTRQGKQADLEPGRRAAEALFGKADVNNDMLLDTQEIYRDPFEFVGLLRLADRNDDNKLSAKELNAYFDLQAKLLSCSTFLTLSERGRPLFELLDADHDGRINMREAATAWERLKGFDTDGDGCISPKELPRQFLLTLGHGQTQTPDPLADRLGYGRAWQFGERQRGPLWFRKMDHNHDGEVSRREFLGSLEDFKKLDRNGDGFLSADEAEQADAAFRPK